MKIDTRRSDVAVSGMVSQREFTVEAGAHIMAVLSNLYKDPVDAMVREYLTNMWDAYVALRKVNPTAKIRTPELHVPSRMDGNLSFTDFGIGMSLEQVWNIYATYGRTTKGADNDEVGGFGLGSKTAFCYNGGASWMVESRKDGVKNIFTAFIGENGVPNLTHVSSIPSDEHSGVTVSIPINREDAHLVAQAVQKYAPYFPMDLKITGDANVTYTKPEYHLRSEKWGFQTGTGYGQNTARVIMGNVPYPIDHNQFQLNGPDTAAFNQFLRRQRVDLFVPIGAVNIVPSRDSLMYTPLTINTIQDCLRSLLEEMSTQLAKQIESCKTEWEAVEQMQVLDKMDAVSFIPFVEWNGKKISTKAVTRGWKDLEKLDPSITGACYSVSGGRAKLEMHDLTSDSTMEMTPGAMNWLILNDMPAGGSMMARALVHHHCVKKNPSGRAASWGHQKGRAYLIQTTLDRSTLGKFFGGMPAMTVETVSHLKGTVAVPTSLKVTKDTIYRWSGSSWSARVNVPKGSDKYYYLPLVKSGARYAYDNAYGSQKDTMEYFVKYANAFGMNVDVIFGMKKDDTLQLPKNWINLEEAIRKEVTAQAKANLRTLALADKSFGGDESLFKDMIDGAELTAAGNSMIDQFNADIIEFVKAKDNKTVKIIMEASNRLRVSDTWSELVKDVKVPKLDKQMAAIFKKYPMLEVVHGVSTKNYYGNGAQQYKGHQKSLLDYLRTM